MNARADDVLVFGDRFSVRPVTESERMRWQTDVFVKDFVPHRVLPTISHVLVASNPPLDVAQPDDFERDLMVWFASAALYTGRLVEASFCETWARRSDEPPDAGRIHGSIQYLPLAIPVSSAPPWQGPISLDAACDGIGRAIEKFRSDQPHTGIFRFAFSRWEQSLNKSRRTAEDAILDLTVALEAIFLLDEERSDRSKKLRERVAAFWCGQRSGKNAREIKNRIANVYDVRSRIVHGNVVDDKALTGAREYLDPILREVFNDFIYGELDNFDPRALWEPRLLEQAFSRVMDRGSERLVFSVAFALFEYALKECIPIRDRRGLAQPNWRTFELRNPSLETVATGRIAEAVRYVLTEPPEVQFAVDGRPEYRPMPLRGLGNQAICEGLRRIRNNLFHGGKEPYSRRDERLVRAGIEIIDGYLSIHDDIRAAFGRGMG